MTDTRESAGKVNENDEKVKVPNGNGKASN
jgi:hypothetical protein